MSAHYSVRPLHTLMKIKRLLRWIAIGAVAIVALFLGGLGYDLFETVTSRGGLLIEASDGAVVRVQSVQRGAVEFLAGTGGVTVFPRSVLPIAATLFAILVAFAFIGAISLFHRDRHSTHAA